MKNGKLAADHPNQLVRRDFLQILLMGLLGGRGLFANPLASPQAPLFREVANDVGLKFRHFTGATGEYYMPEIMGAGVALFDYDNDGDLDVYLIQGSTFDPAQDPRHRNFRRRRDGNPETACSVTCSAKRGSCSSLTSPSKRA